MVFPAVTHDRDDSAVSNDGSQKSAINEVGGAANLRRCRFVAKLWQSELREIDVRKNQALSAAGFPFSVYAILKIKAVPFRDAAMRFGKKIGTLSVNDGVCRADPGTGRLRGP